MLMVPKGNMGQVRDALVGITGQAIEPPPKIRKSWYMLIVRANHQFEAVDSMRRNGIQCFWPTYETLVTTRRHFEGRPVRRLVRIGVVPYIFCPADFGVGDRFEGIISVIDVVRSDMGNPLLVPDNDIEKIRRIAIGLNEAISPDANTNHKFKLGQTVHFRGEQRDWPNSKITKLAPGGRIIVEVSLMGRKVPVTVLPHQIEAA